MVDRHTDANSRRPRERLPSLIGPWKLPAVEPVSASACKGMAWLMQTAAGLGLTLGAQVST